MSSMNTLLDAPTAGGDVVVCTSSTHSAGYVYGKGICVNNTIVVSMPLCGKTDKLMTLYCYRLWDVICMPHMVMWEPTCCVESITAREESCSAVVVQLGSKLWFNDLAKQYRDVHQVEAKAWYCRVSVEQFGKFVAVHDVLSQVWVLDSEEYPGSALEHAVQVAQGSLAQTGKSCNQRSIH